MHHYLEILLLLWGDSGFVVLSLYSQCETNGISYAICLKQNQTLGWLVADIEESLLEKTWLDKVSYAVAYGEFMYQAGSWDYPRRVVCKVEKRTGQLTHMFTFIVTNMDSSPVNITVRQDKWLKEPRNNQPEEVIRFYCKRGVMENFIKESKNGFDFASVSSFPGL